MDLRVQLAQIHKEVEREMGRMCLALEVGRLRPSDLTVWATVLEDAAQKLRQMAATHKRVQHD